MSWVTNAVLTWASYSDEDAEGYVVADDAALTSQVLAQINEFFKDEEGQVTQKGFVSVQDPLLPHNWYGGSHSLECEMAIGAFNYLDLAGLIDHLRNMDWEASESVQLFINDQQDDKFRLINVYEE